MERTLVDVVVGAKMTNCVEFREADSLATRKKVAILCFLDVGTNRAQICYDKSLVPVLVLYSRWFATAVQKSHSHDRSAGFPRSQSKHPFEKLSSVDGPCDNARY